MHGSDMTVVRKVEGTWVAEDRYARASVTPQLDAAADVNLLAAEASAGRTSILFQRPTRTCQTGEEDLVLADVETAVIVAWGDSHDFAYHTPARRATAWLNLFSPRPPAEAEGVGGEALREHEVRVNGHAVPADKSTVYCYSGHTLPQDKVPCRACRAGAQQLAPRARAPQDHLHMPAGAGCVLSQPDILRGATSSTKTMIQVEHTPPATGPTMAQAHDRRRTFVSNVYGSGSGAAQGLALDSGLFVLEFGVVPLCLYQSSKRHRYRAIVCVHQTRFLSNVARPLRRLVLFFGSKQVPNLCTIFLTSLHRRWVCRKGH